jgi:hypothetical protein
MRAFPAPDPRYGEVLAARQVPRNHWRHDHTWVRFSRHVCQKYRHHPTASKSRQWFLGKLASKGQTAAQRAQAHGALDYDAVCLLPAVHRGETTLARRPRRQTEQMVSRHGSRRASAVHLPGWRHTRLSSSRPMTREISRTRRGRRWKRS